jgi:hypothetical protein
MNAPSLIAAHDLAAKMASQTAGGSTGSRTNESGLGLLSWLTFVKTAESPRASASQCSDVRVFFTDELVIFFGGQLGDRANGNLAESF